MSQSINLASLYCDLDRPREALALIEGLGDVSAFGRMQVEHVRLVAAREQGDAAAASRALGYLREHRGDSEETLQEALVGADRPDEAARILVERLRDPVKRLDALTSVQEWVERPRTPRMEAWHARWRALVARPDVQEAIAAAGRVERFAIARDD